MACKASYGVVLLLGIALIGCRPAPRGAAGLQYAFSWNEDRPQERALLQRFTQESGISVANIPVPEASREYVELAHKLLKDGSGPDLLNIDLVWTPVLAPDLIDLQPYLAPELALIEPQLLRRYSVNGKLVAVPFNVPLGGLVYRADLLRAYGYAHPPRSWDELEKMAVRIQTGERTKGNKDFWGYVWQGNAAESLTCNALEWQAAAGGGRIIEQDRTISVNNPAAIKAWQRAKHWIGWISPPGVLTYRETDTLLVFDAGKAAFSRMWVLTPMSRKGQEGKIGWRSLPPVVETGLTRLPAGAGGSAGTLGGTGTAISSHSAHRQEAIALLRFQLRGLIDAGEKGGGVDGATHFEAYNPPSLIDPVSPVSSKQAESFIVARPSIETGLAYKAVTKAYSDAVHSVLTGEKTAPDAAATLEKQLIDITGFRTGPPQTTDAP